jgi:hypothetical protein
MNNKLTYSCILLLIFILSHSVRSQVSVSTQHNNLSRTGENVQETILNTSNVTQKTFGKIFTRTVDDQIYAQPLVIAGVDIPGKGKKNVVYVATVNNTVYAFDADDPSASDFFWKTSFLTAGVVPPKNTDMTGACKGRYVDFSGNMGIVGTPVIDTISGTLFVVARTKTGTTYQQKLHALSIYDGTEKPNSPVVITATYPGTVTTNTFDAQKQNQRPGLLLLNGIVYIAWASHCDWGPYHGWFLGYDANTLEQKIVYNTSPNGSFAGIWMSGQAPSADEKGNIYLVTGNGTVGDQTDPRNVINRGESSLKLTPNGAGLTVSSWFTPYNYQYLEDGDIDLGSSGAVLIPNTNLAMFGGKEGVFYLVNRDTMGGLNTAANDNQIVQSVQVSGGFHFHGSTVYYKGTTMELIYMWLESDYLKAFKFDRTAGKISTAPAYQSTMKAPTGMPGGMLSTSSWNGKDGTGILWAVHPLTGDANHQTRPGILRAFDANDISKELWNSQQNAKRDTLGAFAKFNCPTIANGKVYMGSFSNQLVVYGLQQITGASMENEMENKVQIYPNPSDKDFIVVFGSGLTGHLEVTVYNTLGHVIRHKTIAASDQERVVSLEMSEFPAGIYSVKISGTSNSVTKKIIKK